MDIAICDDDEIHLNIIEGYIKEYKTNICFDIERFDSGESILLSYMYGKRFDIIFLDIRMKNVNGIEVAKEIRKIDRNVIIIFITSFIDYAINGYEVRAFNYLLKPVTCDRFNKIFFIVINEMLKRNSNFYIVKMRNDVVKLELSDIIFIESFGRKLVVHTENMEFEHYGNMSSEEEKLKHHGFVRVHKSYIVNMDHIHKITSKDIVTKNGELIPLGVRRYKLVFDEFTKFLVGE